MPQSQKRIATSELHDDNSLCLMKKRNTGTVFQNSSPRQLSTNIVKDNNIIVLPALQLSNHKIIDNTNNDYCYSSSNNNINDNVNNKDLHLKYSNFTPLLQSKLKYDDVFSDLSSDNDNKQSFKIDKLNSQSPIFEFSSAGSGYLNNFNFNNNNNNNLLKIRRKSLIHHHRLGSFTSNSRRSSSQISKSDLLARERCFDYIVQCIDETWARYCDTTSSAEVVAYNETKILNHNKKNHNHHNTNHQHKVKPLKISDSETDVDDDNCNRLFLTNNNTSNNNTSNNNKDDLDYSLEYKSDSTVLTDCENDAYECRAVSTLPASVKLQSLKYRLTKAKNDMEQTYDAIDLYDSILFWRRWDMIKYNAVEMMEEDDDDDLIDSVIEELEKGRFITE